MGTDRPAAWWGPGSLRLLDHAHREPGAYQPRRVRMLEIAESQLCCGSAGIYNLVEPEAARELAERKVRNIVATGAQVVTAGNPGCLLQLLNGARKEGLKLRVVHPITLLAEAYRRWE